jgi:hypothetical protein
MASIGPFGSAAAQFTLSLILIRAVSPGEFGIFSFLLVASHFSTGLWTALFGAPFAVLLTQEDQGARGGILRAMFAWNLTQAHRWYKHQPATGRQRPGDAPLLAPVPIAD